jgi:hypothetical protein
MGKQRCRAHPAKAGRARTPHRARRVHHRVHRLAHRARQAHRVGQAADKVPDKAADRVDLAGKGDILQEGAGKAVLAAVGVAKAARVVDPADPGDGPAASGNISARKRFASSA